MNRHHVTNKSRPRLEFLEDRTTPAAFYPAADALDEAIDTDGRLSLREAVITANSNGQNDTISLAAGTYDLTLLNLLGQENAAAQGDLDLTEPGHTITFQGAGSGLTSIDANGLDRVFQIFPHVTALFRDLTITGGTARDDGTAGALPDADVAALGGGILNAGRSLAVSNCIVSDNQALGTINLTGYWIGGAGLGGGIYHASGNLAMDHSLLTGNSAQGGAMADFVANAYSGGALGAGVLRELIDRRRGRQRRRRGRILRGLWRRRWRRAGRSHP